MMEALDLEVINEQQHGPMDYFSLESNVRSYCRSFPVTFTAARAEYLFDNQGKQYIDWFSSAGSLNYGHNDPDMVASIIQYLTRNGIMQSLDLHTEAKYEFIKAFHELILKPRQLNYRLAFPGPTGTNAVEMALKFARKATGRNTVVAFTNAFHGMTLGSLSLAGRKNEQNLNIQIPGVFRLPFDGYCGESFDTIEYFEKLLADESSGLNLPAAVVVETIQAEGGVNVASPSWINRLGIVCKHYQIPLIIDDIQTGCGRAGSFFSFENFDIEPDIICLSKSLSGIGLPLSLVLVKEDLDVLAPGEHNGTFRGNNLAFITAACALKKYWAFPDLVEQINYKHLVFKSALERLALRSQQEFAMLCQVKGRGLILGLEWSDPTIAAQVSQIAFAHHLLVETCGSTDNVLKFLPPLTISEASIGTGMNILEKAMIDILSNNK